MRQSLLFATVPVLLSFANEYYTPYAYFKAGFEYGRCLTVSGTERVKGYAITIPVKGQIVFAYYDWLLKGYGLKPVAIKGAVVAKVALSEDELKETENLMKKLKIPYRVKYVDTTGYTFALNCKRSGFPKPASPTVPAGQREKEEGKLPIDLVISDLKRALRDAEGIGQKEKDPEMRLIYRTEFDKEKLIKSLRIIIDGLEEFKRQVEQEENL